MSKQPKTLIASLIIYVLLVAPILAAPPVDWSKGVVDTLIKKNPTGESWKGWGYAKSLALYGEYLVYLRTHDKKYLNHVRDWIDVHLDDKGTINRPITALDYMLPGNLCLILYKEFKQDKYKGCADMVRRAFDTYPRTKEGAFWHANTKSREWQLWADGVFMSLPFLVRYGQMFGESKYTNDEATKQLIIYYSHLNDPKTGLLWHAFDESGQQAWANKDTHTSAEHWARAIGWFGMTLINVLDILPKDHPNRAKLIDMVRSLAKGYERYQDKKTGLWYQVVDKGDVPGNWLETSSSSMYTFMLWMGVKRGYLDKHYRDVASKGYKGVLTQLSVDKDGDTHIENICEGTNVADINYYFARKRNTDDPHGIGAFLIMNEQLRTSEVGGEGPTIDWSLK